MDRRLFLTRSASLAALGLASGSALADSDTYRRFHEALGRHPELSAFAGVEGDQSGEAVVSGQLPRDLNGVYFRNGPGRFERDGERLHHWFDGDGYAQRWQIAGGKVSHRGRFVRTQKFIEESEAGRFLYPAFGTAINRKPVKNNDTINTANTNLLPFAGGVYALWEGGSATELDPVTLETRGLKTWREDMKSMPFSAHPKVDPDGQLWNFGILPGANRLALYQLDASGAVRRVNVVQVPQLNMVHDFVVSARHLVFLVPPYDFSPDSALAFAERHLWAGAGPQARPLRAVVVAKDTLEVRQVFELAPRVGFHLGNAWDDGDSLRLDAVLHEGDALREAGLPMHGEVRANLASRSATVQITLDFKNGQAREARMLGVSEFPRVAPQVIAARHRKLLVLGQSADSPDFTLNSVNLIDTDSGKVDSYRFGAGWRVEEHVLVPRRGARSETDGYLVGVAQDTRKDRTVLTVFDAARVAAGPVALARLPYRSPVCFHGNFLPA
ncbi:carotenoid oxygenase family protein [Oxalobacteraceae bacterium A2-2]